MIAATAAATTANATAHLGEGRYSCKRGRQMHVQRLLRVVLDQQPGLLGILGDELHFDLARVNSGEQLHGAIVGIGLAEILGEIRRERYRRQHQQRDKTCTAQPTLLSRHGEVLQLVLFRGNSRRGRVPRSPPG
ncbi:MAG: hypothetical protein DWQ37_09370 [Planctomycetota bacterium]|nr:MAG: hypothetical protein DWQ37_09370 [Planctomycetota bacterium]